MDLMLSGGLFIDARRTVAIPPLSKPLQYGYQILEGIIEPWLERTRRFQQQQQEECIHYCEQPLQQGRHEQFTGSGYRKRELRQRE